MANSFYPDEVLPDGLENGGKNAYASLQTFCGKEVSESAFRSSKNADGLANDVGE